jgi:cytochrome d ubiquinol oxidase subunit I
VLTSLIALGTVYGALAIVEAWLLVRFVRRGVTAGDGAPVPGSTPQGTPDEDVPGGRDRTEDDVLSFAY